MAPNNSTILNVAQNYLSNKYKLEVHDFEFVARWKFPDWGMLLLFNIIREGHPSYGSTVAYRMN